MTKLEVMKASEFENKKLVKNKYYASLEDRMSVISKDCPKEIVANILLELMELVLFVSYIRDNVVTTKCKLKQKLVSTGDSKDVAASSILDDMYRVRNDFAHANTSLDFSLKIFIGNLQQYTCREEFKDVMKRLFPDPDIPNCIYDIYNLVSDEKTESYKECSTIVHTKLRDKSMDGERYIGRVHGDLKQKYNSVLVDMCILDDLADACITLH